MVSTTTEPVHRGCIIFNLQNYILKNSLDGLLVGFTTWPISSNSRVTAPVKNLLKPFAIFSLSIHVSPSTSKWVAMVYNDTVCLMMSINWRYRRITSAAKEVPMLVGASEVDWGCRCLGIDFTDWQRRQEDETTSTALSTSRAKKYLLIRRLVWYLDGWLNLIWSAVNRSSSMVRVRRCVHGWAETVECLWQRAGRRRRWWYPWGIAWHR